MYSRYRSLYTYRLLPRGYEQGLQVQNDVPLGLHSRSSILGNQPARASAGQENLPASSSSIMRVSFKTFLIEAAHVACTTECFLLGRLEGRLEMVQEPSNEYCIPDQHEDRMMYSGGIHVIGALASGQASSLTRARWASNGSSCRDQRQQTRKPVDPLSFLPNLAIQVQKGTTAVKEEKKKRPK